MARSAKARRFTSVGTGSGGEQTFNPAPGFKFMVCRNDGPEDIFLRFDDAAAPQHWTIKPGESTPTIGLSPRTKIQFRAAANTSDVECLLWG